VVGVHFTPARRMKAREATRSMAAIRADWTYVSCVLCKVVLQLTSGRRFLTYAVPRITAAVVEANSGPAA
jgi:hypothetical protein